MPKKIATDDKILIGGVDISNLTVAWNLVGRVGCVRTVSLEILADDELTINGKTVAEMLGD